MTIEDLKDVKLSKRSRGYLAIYLKLSDLFGEVSDVTGLSYEGPAVDDVNKGFYDAIYNAQEEVIKLFVLTITENICFLDNHTEI